MEMVISNKAIAVLSPGSGDGAYFGKASQLGMLDLYKERLRWRVKRGSVYFWRILALPQLAGVRYKYVT